LSGSVASILSGLVLAGTIGIAAAADTGAASGPGAAQTDPRSPAVATTIPTPSNLLAANDYFDVTDLRPQGGGFVARAVVRCRCRTPGIR